MGLEYKCKYPGYEYSHELSEVIYFGKTKFQTVCIARRKQENLITLWLDDTQQVSELETEAYHKALLGDDLYCEDTERALMFGAGTGTATQMLVSLGFKVDVVDIDEELVSIISKHMPWNKDIYKHPNVNMIYTDAKDYVSTCTKKYDTIIFDLTEPDANSSSCWNKDFFSKCKELLVEAGSFRSQLGYSGIHHDTSMFKSLFPRGKVKECAKSTWSFFHAENFREN